MQRGAGLGGVAIVLFGRDFVDSLGTFGILNPVERRHPPSLSLPATRLQFFPELGSADKKVVAQRTSKKMWTFRA